MVASNFVFTQVLKFLSGFFWKTDDIMVPF
jgi:hypothetical protein